MLDKIVTIGSAPTVLLDKDGSLVGSGFDSVQTRNVARGDTPITTVGIGAKNGATVTAVEYGNNVLHRTVLTCTATPITITDDAGVAQFGGVKVYDFPLGAIATLGAVISGTLTGGVTGTVINTFAGKVALGTVTATTGSTLVSTEADILQSNTISAATAKVATVAAFPVATALTEAGARWFNGTATAIDCFLNFVIDDDASHTAGTAAFTGTITLTWINLGAL